MSDIMIPTLLFWENGNTWYGSKGATRFFIHPVQHQPPEDNPEGPIHTTLDVELWPGPLTKELSQIIATASFPLSEEGLSQITAWLEGQAAGLNR
ncbi:MAG: hypothetical protein AB7E30_10435 [Lawsonibacter sp.]